MISRIEIKSVVPRAHQENWQPQRSFLGEPSLLEGAMPGGLLTTLRQSRTKGGHETVDKLCLHRRACL
jgi:hypothetical protein